MPSAAAAGANPPRTPIRFEGDGCVLRTADVRHAEVENNTARLALEANADPKQILEKAMGDGCAFSVSRWLRRRLKRSSRERWGPGPPHGGDREGKSGQSVGVNTSRRRKKVVISIDLRDAGSDGLDDGRYGDMRRRGSTSGKCWSSTVREGLFGFSANPTGRNDNALPQNQARLRRTSRHARTDGDEATMFRAVRWAWRKVAAPRIKG